MMGKKRLLLAAISLCAVAALAACSPQQAPTGGESDDGGAPAVEAVAWSADSDCASCHAEESAAAADAATGSGFHAGQGVTCASCHADEAMGEVHADYATARPPSELRKTEVQPETCLTSGCHDQAQLKEKTAAATVLTDNNGMTVNPHDLPVNEDHASVTCVMCHEMHGSDPVEEVAPQKCLGCHHKGTYECGSCHGDE